MVLNEISDRMVAKILGADDKFDSYADEMIATIWPKDTPYPEKENPLHLTADDKVSGYSLSKDPIRRDMANAFIEFKKARRSFINLKKGLPEEIAQIEKSNMDPEEKEMFIDRLEDSVHSKAAKRLNSTIDDYKKARERYRAKYGKSPTGDDVIIVNDKQPTHMGERNYSWNDPLTISGPTNINDFYTKSQEQPPSKPKPEISQKDTSTLTPDTTVQPQPGRKVEGTGSTPPSTNQEQQKTQKPTQNQEQSPPPPAQPQPSKTSSEPLTKGSYIKGGLGVAAAGAAIGGSIYAYKRFKNKPRSVIAKRIQALRGVYYKFMKKAYQNPKKANIFKRIAARILHVIDQLLQYLQRKADGR